MSTKHVCPSCKHNRQLSSYMVVKPGQGWYASDGSCRYSYCKYCNRQRVKDYYRVSEERREARRRYMREYHARHKDDPSYIAARRAYEQSVKGKEKERERRERYRQKVRSDPQRLAEEREKNRLWSWEARRRLGLREVPKTGAKATDSEHDERMPREPFAAWLERKKVEYGGLTNLSLATGLGDRTIQRVCNGEQQDRVSIDTVDTALVKEGSTFLWELYPDLYPDLYENADLLEVA